MGNESWIFYNNLVKNATITVSTAALNHEKEKLTDEIVKSSWKSTVITETTISMDFGAATSIAGMSFHFHNVESGDTTYVFEADAAGDFSPADESETITLVTRTIKENNANGVLTDVIRRDAYHIDNWNYRYYRLRITKTSGTHIQGGQLCIWKDRYLFEKNFSVGYIGGSLNLFANTPGPAGQNFRKLQNSKFFLPMRFNSISDSQRIKLEEAGQSNYITYFHGMNSKIYWGGFDVQVPENIRTIDEVTPAEIWNLSATFEESL